MALKTLTSGLVLALAESTAVLPRAVTESTSISTRYGIDAAVTDYTSWYSSINSKYYTEEWTWCGSRVPIYTQYLADKDGKLTKTAYGFISPDILEADGYRVISSMFGGPKPTSPGPGSEEYEAHDYHWHCPPGVEELPCSPGDKPADGKNGSGDENDGGSGGPGEYQAHGDHWHCPEGVEEPPYLPGQELESGNGGLGGQESGSGSGRGSSGECVAHGDHWHCPGGVEEPSYAPDEAPGSEASGKPSAGAESNGCTPHGDHWHCPEGVEEPTPPPPAGSSTLATVKEPAASS
ncbi:hypothetical protein LRP88_12154 [Fusarium phalaenopsidis]